MDIWQEAAVGFHFQRWQRATDVKTWEKAFGVFKVARMEWKFHSLAPLRRQSGVAATRGEAAPSLARR